MPINGLAPCMLKVGQIVNRVSRIEHRLPRIEHTTRQIGESKNEK
jgi:hypothetical protein